MKIGIIVAMESELRLLLAIFDSVTSVSEGGRVYHTGKIAGHEVVATQCGIGKVNAAVGALTLIERFAPEAIINTGVAGGTGGGADVLDVVVADQVAYHDVWCGRPNVLGQVQGLPARFDADRRLVANPALESVPGVRRGLLASGDYFIQTAEDLKRVFRAQPEAVAVDMEAGAIAQVCHLKGVPFLAVRVVSDTPGVENHSEHYASFWDIAPERTFNIVKSLIENI